MYMCKFLIERSRCLFSAAKLLMHDLSVSKSNRTGWLHNTCLIVLVQLSAPPKLNFFPHGFSSYTKFLYPILFYTGAFNICIHFFYLTKFRRLKLFFFHLCWDWSVQNLFKSFLECTTCLWFPCCLEFFCVFSWGAWFLLSICSKG